MALTTALVTGASSGIGYEISKVLAAEGHDLVLVARREERLQQLAQYLAKDFKIEVTVLAADLSDLSEIDRIFDTLKQRNIPVDILVNNAGFGSLGPFTADDRNMEIDQILVNVAATTYMTKKFAVDMVKRGLGKILNIASLSGFSPWPYMAVYGATKAYIIEFSEALRAELKGTGVSVTVSCPGPTASEFHRISGTDNVGLLRFIPVTGSAQMARASVAAMHKRKGVVVHGVLSHGYYWLARILPRNFMLRFMKIILKPKRSGF
ncbi:MAG TPA: SDR family oxidoreductase [Dongiaceae bacterium]|nr:SDR family oxidoreductase [Dongiaceae bacterium]